MCSRGCDSLKQFFYDIFLKTVYFEFLKLYYFVRILDLSETLIIYFLEMLCSQIKSSRLINHIKSLGHSINKIFTILSTDNSARRKIILLFFIIFFICTDYIYFEAYKHLLEIFQDSFKHFFINFCSSQTWKWVENLYLASYLFMTYQQFNQSQAPMNSINIIWEYHYMSLDLFLLGFIPFEYLFYTFDKILNHGLLLIMMSNWSAYTQTRLANVFVRRNPVAELLFLNIDVPYLKNLMFIIIG
ncbi:UNKNOWN [Stylonychia lemnae]|uniref:Uncharacterized protein n=1 Tax=Stylonychia lemnae TaxID=5949 RepID=A0A077ZUW9_STYLE|nr:UNKNOWN [Stylonychia lemnae]|eukprot:CDW73689.1 UNKNOWN [Stylonychia lemnae]